MEKNKQFIYRAFTFALDDVEHRYDEFNTKIFTDKKKAMIYFEYLKHLIRTRKSYDDYAAIEVFLIVDGQEKRRRQMEISEEEIMEGE
jgi:hypothetical protein